MKCFSLFNRTNKFLSDVDASYHVLSWNINGHSKVVFCLCVVVSLDVFLVYLIVFAAFLALHQSS